MMRLLDKILNKKKELSECQNISQDKMIELPPVIEKYRDKIEKTVKEYNEICFSLEETKPWESKLGGCPYLEKLEDYPIGRTERPMMFLAQINLDEMPSLDKFPGTGI